MTANRLGLAAVLLATTAVVAACASDSVAPNAMSAGAAAMAKALA